MPVMEDIEFDRALIASAFTLAAERGWAEVSVTRAARAADLPLDRARERFIGRGTILAKFGRMADQAALAHAVTEGSPRDRLFDLVMRRFDALQPHRAGVLALKSYLPRDPGLALGLAMAHGVSMAFMLEAAGISASGLRGALRVQGLGAIWLRVARTWEGDVSEDLSPTMAALDQALDRAVKLERWLRWDRDGDTIPAETVPETPVGPDDVPFVSPDP